MRKSHQEVTLNPRLSELNYESSLCKQDLQQQPVPEYPNQNFSEERKAEMAIPWGAGQLSVNTSLAPSPVPSTGANSTQAAREAISGT